MKLSDKILLGFAVIVAACAIAVVVALRVATTKPAQASITADSFGEDSIAYTGGAFNRVD